MLTVRRPAQWIAALPWLVSLSAHAAVLVAAALSLPAAEPGRTGGNRDLTVLALPSDLPQAMQHAATLAGVHAATPGDAHRAPARPPGTALPGGAAAHRVAASGTAPVQGLWTDPAPQPLPLAAPHASRHDGDLSVTGSAVAAESAGTPTSQASAAVLMSPGLQLPAPAGAGELPPAVAGVVRPLVAARDLPNLVGPTALAERPAGPAPTPDRVDGGAEDAGLVPAQYLESPPPTYPADARRAGLQGLVRLRARIEADGRVDRVRVLVSSGHDGLDAAALEGVARWRFRPALRGGREVADWLDIPVRFVLAQDGDRRH